MSKRKKRNKKHRSPEQRRKRMRRAGRLAAAPEWRTGEHDEDIVTSYARWFSVDQVCAIIELRTLGFEVAAEREQQVRLAIAASAKANARRRAEKLAIKAEQRAAKSRKRRKRAVNTPPDVFGWWDDWPAEWRLTGEEPDSAPTDGPDEWMSIDEHEVDAASFGLEIGPDTWIPTDEEAAGLRLATWIPTDEAYAPLPSTGPAEWIPIDDEDVALELIGPVEWLLPEEEYAALPWIRPSEWTPTDEDYAALPPIRPQWIPAAEEVAPASIGRARGSRWTKIARRGRRQDRWLRTDEGDGSFDDLPF